MLRKLLVQFTLPTVEAPVRRIVATRFLLRMRNRESLTGCGRGPAPSQSLPQEDGPIFG